MPSDESSLQYFAAATKKIRNARGLSQQELADLAGVSIVSVNVVERAKRGVSLSTLEKIAHALDNKLSAMIEYGFKLSMKADFSGRDLLGNNVKLLREAAGLTQAELAVQAGLSLSTIASIEAARKSAGIDVMQRISVALNVPIAELVREA